MNLFHHPPRLILLAALVVLTASAGAAGGSGSANEFAPAIVTAKRAPDEITVLTYNVKGLPWPVARGRPEALRAIGNQLAAMRRAGRQPDVVVLQEAFVDEAKVIGALAGYRYRVDGPSPSDARPDVSAILDRHWYLGETQGKVLDSGLVLLSDLPVLASERAAFGQSDCAGFDCLATKGALIARLRLRDGSRVDVATAHLNSRGASYAKPADSDAAYSRQAAELGTFLSRERVDGTPLILAGDLNRGNRISRTVPLGRALTLADSGSPVASELADCLARPSCALDRPAEARAIEARAHDLQFAFPGRSAQPVAVAGTIPFRKQDGLSDHAGFAMTYRLGSRAAS